MPKRLLQYALSRLEILDTDALDLENLDIAWGKNSTFEFRDVGLRLKKLEQALQLPSSFEVNKARVILLRLTIPVDIYSSPIVVEVDGVEGQLRIRSKPENNAPRTSHDRKRKRPRSTSFSSGNDDDSDAAIPSAADLAQSFLQAEPDEERAELEAAMLSETQEIALASVLSEDGEIPVGIAVPVSVPGFITRFLEGIVDRLQIRIRGITVNLDLDIPSESPRSPLESQTDPVTIQLKIEDIDIEGVTQRSETASVNGENRQTRHKDGKRLISLSNIRGALISEANLFTGLARSSAMSSPSTTHSEVSDSRRSMYKSANSRGGGAQPVREALDDGRESVTSSMGLSALSGLGKTASFEASMIASDSGRFDDASEEGSNMSESLRESMSESVIQNSAYLDHITESQYLEDEAAQGRYPMSFSGDLRASWSLQSPSSTPRASMLINNPDDGNLESESPLTTPPRPMQQSTRLPTRPRSRFSQGRVSQSQPTLPKYLGIHIQDPRVISDHDEYLEDGDEAATPIGEDLTQSQLFSHEDAESMYMSAISHTSSIGPMPGGWETSNDNDTSKPSSPMLPHLRDSRDNLQHARQHSPSKLPTLQGSMKHSSASIESVRSSRSASSLPSFAQTQRNPSISHASSGLSERSSTPSDEYSRVTKQILVLDQVDIYVPPLSQGVIKDPIPPASGMMESTFLQDDIAQSTVQLPGAFSAHLPKRRDSPNTRPPAAATPQREPTKSSPSKDLDLDIEVDVGQLSMHFDISIGRLVFMIFRQFQEALNEQVTTSKPPPGSTSPAQSTGTVDFKLYVDKIALFFVERLEATMGSTQASIENRRFVEPPSYDVLLRTVVKGLNVSSHSSPQDYTTIISMQKFFFGYAQENIVSFDAGYLQWRTSVRDLKAEEGIDIRATITKTNDVTRCHVMTLPLHISIDLQRLDETFSWFGGLGSVLSLGSSMASNATVTAIRPSNPKPRGVRFETPIVPDDKSQFAQNNASVRIGGVVLDLVGTECSIGVETSAVKIVNRDEGLALSVQVIRLSGPHLKHSNDDPAIVADILSTRLEFLSSPAGKDLEKLLQLITPSNAQYDTDDDILTDILLRQRRQGSVLRLTIDDFKVRAAKLDELSYLPELGEEVSRLATVAKYLPDDDRPGLLSLVTIRTADAQIDVVNTVGNIRVSSSDIEVAQITIPSLVALSVGSISVRRNGSEELVGVATALELRDSSTRAPAIMARMIGDEMEPVVRIKLWNLRMEYRVPTLMTLLGLIEGATIDDMSASMVASVATLTNFARSNAPQASHQSSTSTSCASKPLTVTLVIRDCVVGLNPLGLPSKLLVVLTDAHIKAILPKDQKTSASVDLKKAALLVIDDVSHVSEDLTGRPRRQSFDGGSSQVSDLCAMGYVSVSYISSAKAVLLSSVDEHGDQYVDVELRDDLFVLESCADSTQTLVAVLGALAPPSIPSKETKYRTKVIPVKNLLASLSGDAFGTAEGTYNIEDDFNLDSFDEELGEDSDDLNFDSQFYQPDHEGQYDEDIMEGLGLPSSSTKLSSRDTRDGVLLDSIEDPQELEIVGDLEFNENHFGTGSVLEGTAHRWNSSKNTYDRSKASKERKSPLKVCVRDVHIIWNLFDGYDWQNTRDTIMKAVQDVESQAVEKRARNERRSAFDQDLDDEEETVIGDFLFNSIYIGIPGNRDPRELAAAINQELNDNATETESIATTTVSSSPGRPGRPWQAKTKRLKLSRSKHHKISFELKGVDVDIVTFPPGSGETQSSIDVRVNDLEVFDNIPTSTWRKFATYMQDAGEKERGSSMVHIEILNVKPVPNLAAAEIVLKATVLPLRLHVDQDALDFITRFFEFKDDSAPVRASSPGDIPFIQRAEINDVVVKLDFKPKRVDYAGLRSGHTTEFMNFLILDEADMVLRHTIIYGISGFDKLGKCLNDIWMPEIKRNQLPGILAGLAPVRSIVNVGGGLKHLVAIPIREYKKDGRIVRSISKGASAFAKTTGTELVKLGAKVAIGVQTYLQGAEGFLGPTIETSKLATDEEESDEAKQISLYANQPVGVLQGLRGGYTGLQRDLVMARDAIIAVSGEAMEGGNAAGVLRAVRKHAPTVILRPAIGVAKAGGQILMGATNSLDPVNLQRADAVSFRPCLYGVTNANTISQKYKKH
ncbi:hypothetical protein BJ875DRAFT_530601 [Amylocarpus encephaloides]|uniref:Autophagy-related protein 2 n=1 Tax=Amylocarpus encephaloides TaxID=45428 RepID=A0A9P7YJX9_9HELO|nr:hypothetical protein BJ875DRAFT_530601 [Amylocarpus encephaloides]